MISGRSSADDNDDIKYIHTVHIRKPLLLSVQQTLQEITTRYTEAVVTLTTSLCLVFFSSVRVSKQLRQQFIQHDYCCCPCCWYYY